MPEKSPLQSSLILWVQSKLRPDRFFFFSSILVGLTAGLAAVVLKYWVYYIHYLITYNYNLRFQYYIYLAFPFIGILISAWFIKKFLNGKLGRGNARIVYAIEKQSGILPQHQMYSHVLTAGLTVGFGGSAGLEAPIVSTGAAIGSNYGREYKLNYRERTLLLAAGAAGGIAGAFNAPIAGVLFASEVLLSGVSISGFIPLLVAAAAGAIVSRVMIQEALLFHFSGVTPFNYVNVPYYLILGLLCGFVSVYYSRTFPRLEGVLARLRVTVFQRALIGGILLAILILAFPPLFGEGYESVKYLGKLRPDILMENGIFSEYRTHPWMLLGFLTVVMLMKVVAAAITLGSGGNGGNFAPSLFVGAYLGFTFCLLSYLLGFGVLPHANFMLVGMAGILTGVFHAPLTGIFLIAEISGGYDLLIPLMIVSAISYTVVRYYESYSMDMKRLAMKGEILVQDKEKNILGALKASSFIEKDFKTISSSMSLGDIAEIVSGSRRNIFPVVNGEGRLEGVVLLDNIREIIFRRDMYDTMTVKHFISVPPAVIAPDEDLFSVMKKFDETAAWNLPVLDQGKYLGFISKSTVFSEYRRLLKDDAAPGETV